MATIPFFGASGEVLTKETPDIDRVLNNTMDVVVQVNENGKLFTTSLLVAEKFEKEHKNVLRDIEELLPSLDKEFGRLNFEPTEYVDQFNRSQPCYNLSRDGFSLLAMGFTGQKALQWKVKFIEAFNKMEKYCLLGGDDSTPRFKDAIEAAEAFIVAEKARRAAIQDLQKSQKALLETKEMLIETKHAFADYASVTADMLTQLGLQGAYQQVKGFSFMGQIITKEADGEDSKFWANVGKAVVSICKHHGGQYLSPARVPTQYLEFRWRHTWDIVRLKDFHWGTVNVYPTCAMFEFREKLIAGEYDKASWVKYLKPNFKDLLEAIIPVPDSDLVLD